MMNHNNAKTNVKHLYNPYKDPVDKTGYEIVTTKPVRAGEELYVSYNQCPSVVCDETRDWMGTPELFLHFGFVEAMPQRWLFDFARVKYDLDWKDGNESSGEVVVDFLVPPSKRGVELLQVELSRLESFSNMYRSKETSEYEEIPTSEWELLWQYYDALHKMQYHLLSSKAVVSCPMTSGIWVMIGGYNRVHSMQQTAMSIGFTPQSMLRYR